MSRRSERERDYFVSTCLKVGSVASWVFFFSPPPPALFTQSVQRHTRACLRWVFVSEAGQGFQLCVLALPPRRHREARSVTRPHGASSLCAYPPLTSPAPASRVPGNLGATGSRGAHWVDFTFRMRAFGGGPRRGALGGTDGKAGGTDMGICDFSRRVWIPRGPLMKLARRGLAPGLGR